MAVTIVRSPNDVVGAYNCLEWVLSISDIGSDDIVKSICYKLVYDTGSDITETEIIRPFVAGMEVPLNFAMDVQGLVATSIPIPDVPAVSKEEMSMIKVKLMYGEVIYDKATCEPAVVNLNQESDIVIVLNGATQAYENPFTTSPRILDHQPRVINQNRQARNFSYLFGTSPLIGTASDGEVVNFSAPFELNYIPLHPQQLFTNWYSIKWFKINFVALGITKLIYLDDECTNNNNYVDILFLDPLGGRNMMSFEDIESFELSSDFTVVERYVNCGPLTVGTNDGATKLSVGGSTPINKSIRDRITLSKYTEPTEENREWFKAFLASPGHHVQLIGDGSFKFQKFILESASVVYHSTEESFIFSIVGYLAPEYIIQKQDR